MPIITTYAPGKIILSGEYAMLFGEPGIALPWKKGITATFDVSQAASLNIVWKGNGNPKICIPYIQKIVNLIDPKITGTLIISSDMPIGKGMGSSTAMVIAVTRALLGPDCKIQALTIEDQINPGHSGMDFAVIWENEPIIFTRGSAPNKFLSNFQMQDMYLIDTGMPDQTTPELVAWVKGRSEQLKPIFQEIGNCTKSLLVGEPLYQVMRRHHQAQIALGVVPDNVQKFIKEIEVLGGSGKIIGAGGKTGGGGTMLSLGIAKEPLKKLVQKFSFSFVS